MTIGGILASLFPLFYLVVNTVAILHLFEEPGMINLVILIFGVYLFPLVIFWIHSLFFKVEEGDFDLSKKIYNPWWTSHMLQFPFIALPFLESILHFIPGLYSLWLRGWGAKIGKKVFWTPRTEILDRNLVEIGNGTIVGHLTVMVSHLVETRSGAPILVLKKVRIGDRCLVGADAQLGPGAEIASGTNLKPKVRLFWKGEWK